ncbi:MAG: MGMT family protein [Glaciecola sp.]
MNGKHSPTTEQLYTRIFDTIDAVPEGKVVSYGQIADLAGLPGRARMVGKSLGHVPSTRQVNWHRVLRANGQLAFAKGSEQALRQTGLLQSEGIVVLNNRVNMKTFRWHPDLSSLLHTLQY